jgi:anti-sigma-K factor RskA
MTPDEENDLDAQAGEYVLGVLEEEERRRLALKHGGNPRWAKSVAFWEQALHGLTALADPEEPPPEIWRAIAAKLDREPKVVPLRSLKVWRASTLVSGLAAAAALLFVFFGPQSEPDFVAVLRSAEAQTPEWVATERHGQVFLRSVGGADAPAGKTLELWAIPASSGRPVPVGLIAPQGRFSGKIPGTAGKGDVTLAISVEPEGGSPTGQPTGPVVSVGALIATR